MKLKNKNPLQGIRGKNGNIFLVLDKDAYKHAERQEL